MVVTPSSFAGGWGAVVALRLAPLGTSSALAAASTTVPSDLPYALPVTQLPSVKSSPPVAADATYIPLANDKPLPISERTVAGADVEVASFSRWGDHFSVQVPPPPQVVPYSVVAR